MTSIADIPILRTMPGCKRDSHNYKVNVLACRVGFLLREGRFDLARMILSLLYIPLRLAVLNATPKAMNRMTVLGALSNASLSEDDILAMWRELRLQGAKPHPGTETFCREYNDYLETSEELNKLQMGPVITVEEAHAKYGEYAELCCIDDYDDYDMFERPHANCEWDRYSSASDSDDYDGEDEYYDGEDYAYYKDAYCGARVTVSAAPTSAASAAPATAEAEVPEEELTEEQAEAERAER